MRFEVTSVLDAIERHLTTDAALAQVVVDLGEVAWFDALDGGRPVNLLRVGLLVDALVRHYGDDAFKIYPVAGRALLTDADLTSKERMVLGRWAGDGLIEVVPTVDDRVCEIADMTGLPVVTRTLPTGPTQFPWLHEDSGRVLLLVPGEGGAQVLGPVAEPASNADMPVLSRVWRCPRRECPTFGDRRLASQAVPRLRAAVPVCPRHEEPLANAGPRLASATMVLIVDGRVRDRFVVRTGPPLVVGRSPEAGISIGAYVTGGGVSMISRSHLRLELHRETLLVHDTSTNGTVIRSRTSPFGPTNEVRLTGGEPYATTPWDSIELHERVVLVRSAMAMHLYRPVAGSSSVMADAPTIALRPTY